MRRNRLDKAARGRGSSGFTLVELLVVVMIIAILATVALPKYFRTVERSRLAEVTNAAAALNTAEQRYFMGKSSFGSVNELDIDLNGGTFKFFSLAVTPAGTSYSAVFSRDATPTPPDGTYDITFSGDSNGVSSWGPSTLSAYLQIWQ